MLQSSEDMDLVDGSRDLPMVILCVAWMLIINAPRLYFFSFFFFFFFLFYNTFKIKVHLDIYFKSLIVYFYNVIIYFLFTFMHFLVS